jgi:hypothetical protein
MLVLGGRSYRYYSIKRRSINWPVTQGTIQKGEAKFIGPAFSLWTSKIPKSLFGYSYEVNGARYIGFFAIITDTKGALGAGPDIQEKLDGKALTIRYDPMHPQRSFVVDREVSGNEVHQGPDWVPLSLSS